jgi:hypothetical protein
MPKRIAPLSLSAVASAKAQTKPYTLYDGLGLQLIVQPRGGRWWRLVYRRPFDRKRNTLSLGTYPDVSLIEARERRDEARILIADGIDPGEIRKTAAVALQAKRKLAAFSLALSPAGALSITVTKITLNLTPLQTEAVRRALIAQPE